MIFFCVLVSARGRSESLPAYKYYTSVQIGQGDTLWGIAGQYGVPLTALIGANPQIKNPNLIYPGDRVNLP